MTDYVQYDNTNKGVLFVNHKKTSDRSPNTTGGAEIKCPGCDGVHNFKLSAWTNTIKQGVRAGEKMLNVSFEAQQPVPAPTADPADPADQTDVNQDIPF